MGQGLRGDPPSAGQQDRWQTVKLGMTLAGLDPSYVDPEVMGRI